MLRSPRLRPSWLISYARNTVVEINRNVMTQALDSKTNQVVRSDWGLTRRGLQRRTCCRSWRIRQLGGTKATPFRTAFGRASSTSSPSRGAVPGCQLERRGRHWRGGRRRGIAQRLEVNVVVNSLITGMGFCYPAKTAKIAGLVLQCTSEAEHVGASKPIWTLP